MCGRFTSTSSIEDLALAFDVDEIRTDPLPARYNVAPTQPVLAVACRHSRTEGGNGLVRALGAFRWGLVPSWAKDPSVGNRMINARAETVATKPAYREALARRRCLIPADAFYEWQSLPDAKSTASKSRAKQPYAIRLASAEPMALAGLWEVWRDPRDRKGDPLRSCVIVTTSANEALRPIHDRMPVVLGRDAWDRWLDPSVSDMANLLEPAPGDWFNATPISTLVNSVERDGPELLEPAAP